MIGRLIRRLLGRTPTAPRMMGTNPGYLYDVHGRRWVRVEQALKTRHDAYSHYGPVYVSTGLQP